MGRRLRRNYSWIFAVMVVSWVIKVAIHPSPTTDPVELLHRAQIGPIIGPIVLAVGFFFNGALILLALSTATNFRWQRSSEVSSRSETREMMGAPVQSRNWWE